MKRLTRALALTAAIGLLAAPTVQARGLQDYFQCLKTPPIEFDGTIADAAVANPFDNLGVLLQAVLAADPSVLDTLSDPEADLTVFAPVDEAFLAIPEPILAALLDDPALVTDVLLYHVLPKRFDPRRVFYIRAKGTALGQPVFISRDGDSPYVNGSEVQCQGVVTHNGTIWLVDSVLQPQFFPAQD